MPNEASTADIRLTDIFPPVDAYIALRTECGWGEISREAAIPALERSMDAVTALNDAGDVVGFVRVVGDPMYLYIQDMIVVPELRGQGLGQMMMERLLPRLKSAWPEAVVMLMCAEGRERFYAQFGFEARPSDGFGPGMQLEPDRG